MGVGTQKAASTLEKPKSHQVAPLSCCSEGLGGGEDGTHPSLSWDPPWEPLRPMSHRCSFGSPGGGRCRLAAAFRVWGCLAPANTVPAAFPTAQFEGSEKSCLSPGREEKGRLPPRLSAGNPKSAKPLSLEPSSPLGEWTDPALPLENQV